MSMISEILENDGRLTAEHLNWLAANYPAQKVTVLWNDGKLIEENARHTLKMIATEMHFQRKQAPAIISLTAKARLRLSLDLTPKPNLP